MGKAMENLEAAQHPAGGTVSHVKSAIKYRADIDGLRAIAVLSVLAFHVGLFRMTGGFVGVDVFFVISGYLLSAIVFSEIASSRFSIVDFYERRIRRIFPALFGTLIAFTCVASIYFLPTTLVEYSRSLLASTTFASNFYFWRHSGYFDAPLSNPLLHTWSLAVEEQFYILFPVCFVLIRRFFPQRLRASVVAFFVLSFASSAVMVYYAQVTTFYMIFTRAWELLLGTVLSLGMFPRLRSVWLRNLVTLVGIGMIAYSAWFYTEATIFPGLSAVLPCVGAALIIGAGESGLSVVGAVLSWRPIVFVGLISYSLYLWHWPVIILHRMGVFLSLSTLPTQFRTLLALTPLTPIRYGKSVEVVASFALAVLSWRFVERPFRSGILRLDGRPLFVLTGVVMFIFVAVSSLTIFSGGFTGRFPSQAIQIASSLDSNEIRKAMRVGTCFITGSDRFEDYDYDSCLHRDGGKKTYLLLGDSHAAALWKGLSSLTNVNMMQASSSGCGPFVDASDSFVCRKMMSYIFSVYLPAHPVDGLLLGARWQSKDIPRLSQTLDWAKQHQVPVILFGPVPEYDMPLPLLLAYSIAWKKPDLVSEHRVGERKSLDARLHALAVSTWRVPYISLYEAVCQNDCIVYSDAEHKIPLLNDDSHLSPAGSSVIVHRLVHQGKLGTDPEQGIVIGASS